ncbi:hypothetical protein ABT063_06250 [Streptomyces sp. NPDC002838]|uniref:hypothetical protein n=1 Tax=Streptomyces sp. NPDC002838 TaxID=3154436 RepID=UPI00332FB264
MFDFRKEAEMRLHSEKLARELALAKQREEGDKGNTEDAVDGAVVTTDAEPVEVKTGL